MDGQHRRQLLDAELLDSVLPAVALLARVLCGAELFAAGEAVEAALQRDVIVFGGFRLLFLGEIADVEAEVHVRVQRGGRIAAVVAGHGAGEAPVEGLMYDAVAVF